MDRKIIVAFILMILLVPSFNTNLLTRSTSVNPGSASTVVYALPNQASMIGLDLELQRSGNGTYFSVNNTKNAKINDVVNNTYAIFVSTFVNLQDSPATLSSFTINIFNDTVTTVAAKSITKTYDTTTPSKIQVPTNGSYTEYNQSPIYFDAVDKNYQIQFTYTFTTVANSNQTVLVSPFNYTLHSANAPYAPPEFVIWVWWAINGLIAIHVAIGWYGNRKMKKKVKTNSN